MFRPIATFFDKSPTYKIIGVLVAIIGIPAAVLNAWEPIHKFIYRSEDDLKERAAIIDRAREILLRKASGDTGKGQALTTLFREHVSMDGLDLSCKALGDIDKNGNCINPIIFSGIDMQWEGGNFVYIENIDLSDAIITEAVFHRVSFDDADFTNVKFKNIRAHETRFTGRLVGAEFIDSSIIHSYIDNLYLKNRRPPPSETDLTAVFQQDDLSGTVYGALGDPFNDLNAAWADDPPLPEVYQQHLFSPFEKHSIRIVLCEPPVDKNGAVIPKGQRDPISAIGIFLFPSGQCKPVEWDDAVRRFPDIWTPTWGK